MTDLRRSPRANLGKYSIKELDNPYNARSSVLQEERRSRLRNYNKLLRIDDGQDGRNRLVRFVLPESNVDSDDDRMEEPRRKSRVNGKTKVIVQQAPSYDSASDTETETDTIEDTYPATTLQQSQSQSVSYSPYPQAQSTTPVHEEGVVEQEDARSTAANTETDTSPQSQSVSYSPYSQAQSTTPVHEEGEVEARRTEEGEAGQTSSEQVESVQYADPQQLQIKQNTLRNNYSIASLDHWIYSVHLEKALVPDFRRNYSFENEAVYTMLDEDAIRNLTLPMLETNTIHLLAEKTILSSVWNEFYSSKIFDSGELMAALG